MLVKKDSVWYQMVKDKTSMSDSNHPNHDTLTYLGNVLHSLWVYGLIPFLALILILWFFLDKYSVLQEDAIFKTLVLSIYGYVGLLFFILFLLFIIEPFASKEWKKLKVV